MRGSDLKLEVAIPADWERIDPVRKAVALCIAAVFANEELRDALSMVCSELLENAIKYGKPSRVPLRIAVREDREELVVSVTHAIDEASIHVGALRARLAWIGGFSSAAEAYVAALSEIYEGADVRDDAARAQEGGLGLVRIAYEGGCRLECDCPSPGVLTVRACCATGDAAAPPSA